MQQRQDRGWSSPRARGRHPRRHPRWLLRALALPVAVGVVALAGDFSPQTASSPGLRLTSGASNPNPPTNVVATGSDRALLITWTASTEQHISGYQVYLDGTLTATTTGTGTSTSISGLVNGHGYAVTVSTSTSFGAGSFTGTVASTAVTGTPRDAVPPVAPTGLTAARGDATVSLSWTADSADYDADGYRVLRGGTAVSGLLAGRTTTAWTDTGLTNDTTYGYTVQTHDTSGNWSASSTPVVSATPTDLTAPSVPAGLTATRGDQQVRLSWTADPEPDVATYRLLRGGVEVGTVPAGTTTYLDTGLTNDTSYSYALAAVDTHGNRSATSSPAVTATPTDLTPPAVPRGLGALRGDATVSLSWFPGAEGDLASYRVLRGGTEVASIPAGTTSWTDTGVVDDTTYSYTLVAVDTHGNRSAASAAVSATPTDLVAPAAPTGLTGGRGDARAGLAWAANGEGDLASYRVLRDGVEVATVPAGTTTWLDTGLTNDRSYTYALVAVDGHGNRSPSSATVQVTPTDLTPPAAPTGLAAARGDGSVALTWAANGEGDLASYRVLRDGVEIAWVPAGTTSYLDTGLTDDVTRTYTLAAVDTHGNRSVSSPPVSATPTDLGAPATPTGLTADRGDGAVSLAWTANTDGDLAAYRVLRDGAEVATVPAGTTSWVDTGLTDDRTYGYALVAVDTHGNRSGPSATVSATPTDQTPPSVPAGLTAVRGDGRVTLGWTADPEPDVASYRVLRDGAEVATVASGTGWVDGGLTDDTTYSYAVVAVDTRGNRSAPSAAVSAIPTDLTPPVQPTGLTAVRGENDVSLSWTATGETDLASYRVLRDGTEVATVVPGDGWVDTGLADDTSYTYTLVAVDTHGNRSVPSEPATAFPTDLTPPAVPTGLTAAAGDGSVALTWAADSEPDLASYRVLRDGVEVAVISDGTSWLDTPLRNGTSYRYALVAVDTHGNRSPASAPATATPVDVTPPGVPTGPAATAGDGWAVLTWTPATEPDLASYRVLRDGVEVAAVPAGTTSWTDSGLTDDTTYGYALVAVDTSGNRSAACAPVWATPLDTTPPAPPSGLAAAAGDGRVALSWAAGSEPDLASYRVLRDGVEVATVAGGTGYLDGGLVGGTTYTYALVAVDTHGNRSVATAGVAATPADRAAPAAPGGLVAVAGDQQATLTWTAGAEQDLAGYRVLRDGTEVATLPAGTTSWTDTGLVDGTTYGWTVVAVDTAGNPSAESSPAWATPIDAVLPAAPTGLTATLGDHRVVLTWTAVGAPDLASYRVLRDGVEVVTVLSGTGWVDTGLTEGVAHTWTVVAVDAAGNRSAPSDPVTAQPADTAAPAAPAGFTATPGDTVVTLLWAAGAEPDLASYLVLRGGLEVATVPAGTTSWTDTGLVDGTTYSYALVAVDTAGNRSPAGGPVDATPADPSAPAAPTGLTAVPGDRQVVLAWAANGEPDLASYRVLRDGDEVATVPAGTPTWTDAGVSNGTPHSYALVAVDTSGNRSAASSPVTATPADAVAPAAPTSVGATPAGGSVTVRWTAPADDDLAAYRVLDGNGATVATVPAPATSATVTGLTDGTAYRFTVVAVDTSGNVGPASAAVTVTPSSAPAPVPTTGAGDSGGVAVSGDGRWVVIGTKAQLEASDTNTAYELYLVDRSTRGAHRIAPLGASATSSDSTNTAAPAISDDGRYVALATTAALVPGDRNGLLDVYRYDATTGTWALASVPAGSATTTTTAGTLVQSGVSVTATSPSVAMSADGDLVCFYSARSDLVTGDSNGVADLFAKRMSTGAVTRVSTSSTGGSLAGYTATGPALALTPDGQFALFPATPTAGGSTLLYRKTLTGPQSGTLLLVSTVTVGGHATSFGVYRDAGDVAISDDGRYVALSTANEITTASPASSWTTGLAYRVDTSSGAVLPLGSGQTTTWEHQVELDPTGRYGFFTTSAGELAGDTNAHPDCYRRDLAGDVTGPLLLVTADASGQATTGPTGSVTSAESGRVSAVTGDRVLVTTSQALLPSDTNKVRDLYAKDLVTGAVASAL